jgi:hypothetical protein
MTTQKIYWSNIYKMMLHLQEASRIETAVQGCVCVVFFSPLIIKTENVYIIILSKGAFIDQVVKVSYLY